MRILNVFFVAFLFATQIQSQNPAITAWLQNNSILGSYYTQGNSIAQSNNIAANVQNVQYSSSFVYVSTNGIPA